MKKYSICLIVDSKDANNIISKNFKLISQSVKGQMQAIGLCSHIFEVSLGYIKVEEDNQLKINKYRRKWSLDNFKKKVFYFVSKILLEYSFLTHLMLWVFAKSRM